jgi:hypothetical protein
MTPSIILNFHKTIFIIHIIFQFSKFPFDLTPPSLVAHFFRSPSIPPFLFILFFSSLLSTRRNKTFSYLRLPREGWWFLFAVYFFTPLLCVYVTKKSPQTLAWVSEYFKNVNLQKTTTTKDKQLVKLRKTLMGNSLVSFVTGKIMSMVRVKSIKCKANLSIIFTNFSCVSWWWKNERNFLSQGLNWERVNLTPSNPIFIFHFMLKYIFNDMHDAHSRYYCCCCC